MNKRKVEAYLPKAIEALNAPMCNIREKETINGKEQFTNKIKKTFRSYISSFGAAVIMGSFKAAVAFFSKQSSADLPRQELIRAVWFMVKGDWRTASNISETIIKINDAAELARLKEEFINASLAIKLAVNAYDLVE